jgi:hypothetical protein
MGAATGVLGAGLVAAWLLAGGSSPVQAASQNSAQSGDGTRAAASSADSSTSPEDGSTGPGDSQRQGTPAAGPLANQDPDQLITPLTPEVVEHLRKVKRRVSGRKDDVFAKVGDSATVNKGFVQCFSKAKHVDLGKHQELADTVKFFREGNAAYGDPYRRDSKAAKVGWSSRQVVSGRPSPLLKEVRAISPRFALVMLGTNEIEPENLRRYSMRMREIVDKLTRRGVIPILYTVPPRNDDEEADALIPRYNLVLEAIARHRRVPLVDLHAGMIDLPNRGLAKDQLHPSVPIVNRRVDGCDLTDEGLQNGQNLRNLLTIKILDRLRTLVLAEEGEPDDAREHGSGTPGDPFRMDGIPFSWIGDTSKGSHDGIDTYPACDEDKQEAGPEDIYRLQLDRSMTVRAALLDGNDADMDLHVLGDEVSGKSCLVRGDRALRADLDPGTYHIAVDTFSGSGTERPGEYILVVDEAPEGEADDDGAAGDD